jgi:hypothetical protein
MKELVTDQLTALECEQITGGYRNQYAYTTSSGSVNASQFQLGQSVSGGGNNPVNVPPFAFAGVTYTAAPLNYSNVQQVTTGNSNNIQTWYNA